MLDKALTDPWGRPVELMKNHRRCCVEAQLTRQGDRHLLQLTAHVRFSPFVTPAQRQAVRRGICSWAGDYRIFGDQPLRVAVTLSEKPGHKRFWVLGAWPGFRSFAFGGGSRSGLWGWKSAGRLPRMMVLGTQKGVDKKIGAELVRHEFGHLLGLGDIYRDLRLGLMGVPPGTYKELDPYYRREIGRYHMVMDDNGPVRDIDIALVLRAFQTGRRQDYQRQSFLLSRIDRVSDCLTAGPVGTD